jgi:heme/copper-type cytochrome/quinol oxidase subunit 4
MRFIVTLFIALIVLTALQPWLQKLGIGRLPGDFRFRLGKREYLLPFASTLLLTVVAFLIGRLI